MAGEVKITSTQEFDDLKNQDGFVLVDFWAQWCGPCLVMNPVLEEVVPKFSNLKLAKVNVDELPDLASKFGVTGIPNFKIFKVENGEMILKGEIIGAQPSDKFEQAVASVVKA